MVRQPQFQRGSVAGKRGAVYNMGVKQILKYYADQSNLMTSDLAYVNWQASEGVSSVSLKQQYRSAERSATATSLTIIMHLSHWLDHQFTNTITSLHGSTGQTAILLRRTKVEQFVLGYQGSVSENPLAQRNYS